jgi:hypothetical protein
MKTIFGKLKEKYDITLDTEIGNRQGTDEIADCIFMYYGK